MMKKIYLVLQNNQTVDLTNLENEVNLSNLEAYDVIEFCEKANMKLLNPEGFINYSIYHVILESRPAVNTIRLSLTGKIIDKRESIGYIMYRHKFIIYEIENDVTIWVAL
ncbi:hypothetical protein [Flectobacillus roseus]|uniref:hypothetical protein n=1 Tax=Flectobacillus roseus TaxID=502259 RepID=UPI0024B720B9|nr:hypothetical protein [Flectobacillus roseus]MDI9870595.1 hypothetical protein [Flectobacillus roseus]